MLVLLACAGCDSMLGIGETKFTGGDGGPDAKTPDACLTCGTFASCKALKAASPSAPSGVYSINAGTGMYSVYCDQTGDGGGWTLALKVDGRLQTFNYDALLWSDATLLNATSPGFDHTEAKLETWNAVAFTELRVALEYPIDSGTIQSLVLPIGAPKLADLFAATAAPQVTTLGRDAWKGLMGAAASLQLNCNAEGTNAGNGQMRIRIGIIGNEQTDCGTPDSRIGVGGAGATCLVDPAQTAGNSSCYGGDNGDVELAAFGWVYVR
jgi:hypothetical protein